MDTFQTVQISDQPAFAEGMQAIPRRAPFDVKLQRILERNFSDPTFNLPRMAEQLHLSERQLQRRLKISTGKSPVECLRSFRLQKATQLLISGLSIAEAAYLVGFASQSYFAACFKAQFGTTATEYRRSWY